MFGGLDWHPMRLRVRVRIPKRRFSLLLVLLFITLFLAAFIFDYQHNYILRELFTPFNNVVVHSATLYKRGGESYPPNTAIILLSAHQLFAFKYEKLKLLAISSEGSVEVSAKIRPVIDQLPFYCPWQPFTAAVTLPEHADKLAFHTPSGELHIPMRKPVEKSSDSVVCITPLFLHDHWQTLLLSITSYAHFKATIHVYVRSMILSEFEILKTFEDLHVSPWPKVLLGKNTEDDPNQNLEFRNQAAAMTDCLLLYKESAEFIFFPDLDDVLIPRLGPDFNSEFAAAFEMFPTAAVIAYNMSQCELKHAPKKSFVPSKLFNSVRMTGEVRWGKLVVRPKYVESVWIHESYGITNNMTQVLLPNNKSHIFKEVMPLSNNSLLHLRYWKEIRNSDILHQEPTTDEEKEPLVQHADLKKMDIRFHEIQKSETFQSLPNKSAYYPIINNCYNEIFYNGDKHGTEAVISFRCKGPELCAIPPIHILCMNAEAKYKHRASDNGKLHYHVQMTSELTTSAKGCTI